MGIYATRALARELASLPDAARDERVLEHAETLQSGVKDHVINMASKSWDADPFQRGAYAWYEPNQLTAFGDSFARPEGQAAFCR